MTSPSSPAVSAAMSGTATVRPRGSSSSVVIPPCRRPRIGPGADTVKVLDPETGSRSARRPSSARRSGRTTWTRPSGRSSRPATSSGFEGYYKNEEATQDAFPRRVRTGRATSPTGTRDGWFYFAGR